MKWILKMLFSSAEEFEKARTYRWLSESSSLADLERRQRQIERGQAPWQVRARSNTNLTGWV